MKSLVIYDSQYGNTEKIARVIGEALGSGTRVVRAAEAPVAELQKYGLLVVGSPTHGGRPSQPMQQFLNQIPSGTLTNVRTATFDTGIPTESQKRFIRFIIKFFGYAAKRIAATLRAKGATIVAAETFFVLGKEGPLKEGEADRAASWARNLQQLT